MDHGSKRISRHRPQLSCTACRKRKLKCDRKSPCDSCNRRAEQHLCTYLPSTLNQRDPGKSGTAQARIARLERLVNDLNAMNERTSNAGSVDPYRQRHPVSLATQHDTNPLHTTSEEILQGFGARPVVPSMWEDILVDVRLSQLLNTFIGVNSHRSPILKTRSMMLNLIQTTNCRKLTSQVNLFSSIPVVRIIQQCFSHHCPQESRLIG